MVEVNTTPPGMEQVRETFEIRPQVTISLLYRSGKVEAIAGEDQAALVRFLKDNRAAFLTYIDEHSTPIYNFDYSHLNSVFDEVFRNRRLPGRPTTGLFETQRHVAAAGYAALQRRKGILICGEMGCGKSAIGAAIISALHANGQVKPGKIAVIMTPPHLVNKWVREVQDAIPGCQVEIVTDVDDTVTFMKLAEANPRRLYVMVLSREKAKLGEGWEPAILTRKRHIAQWPKVGPIPIQFLDPDTRQPKSGTKRIITQKQLCCPTCGQPIPSKKDLSDLASRSWLERQLRVCYRCQAPLWQLKRRWSGPKKGEKFPRRNPRYPLARFLRERYADRVGVVEFDEIHERAPCKAA